MPLLFATTASFFDCSAVSQIVVRFIMVIVCANAIRLAIVRKYKMSMAGAIETPRAQAHRESS
jgi:hypothetical protein